MRWGVWLLSVDITNLYTLLLLILFATLLSFNFLYRFARCVDLLIIACQRMKPNHLLAEELNYELRIRGVVTTRDIAQRRKILARILDKERVCVIPWEDSEYAFDTEVANINKTIDSVRAVISEFDGPETDSAFKRAKSRLIHLINRIQRIKNESYATALELEAELYERVRTDESSLQSAVSVPAGSSQAQNVPVHIPNTRSVPVYKWGVHFDGNSRELNSFLERVNELAEARHVSKRELFSSAVDLFTGKALLWYRSVKATVTDWEGLVSLLKQEFLPTDFDDKLWDEIKARVQGRGKAVLMYIAVMETLFGRLNRLPCETTKVKYIRQNLLPNYYSQLALSKINTVNELTKLCKKLEENRLSANAKHQSIQRPYCSVVEPELFFMSEPGPSGQSTFWKDSKTFDASNKSESNNNALRSKTRGSVVCLNCELPNHTYRTFWKFLFQMWLQRCYGKGM